MYQCSARAVRSTETRSRRAGLGNSAEWMGQRHRGHILYGCIYTKHPVQANPHRQGGRWAVWWGQDTRNGDGWKQGQRGRRNVWNSMMMTAQPCEYLKTAKLYTLKVNSMVYEIYLGRKEGNRKEKEGKRSQKWLLWIRDQLPIWRSNSFLQEFRVSFYQMCWGFSSPKTPNFNVKSPHFQILATNSNFQNTTEHASFRASLCNHWQTRIRSWDTQRGKHAATVRTSF